MYKSSCPGQAKLESCCSEGQAVIHVFFSPYFAKMNTTETKESTHRSWLRWGLFSFLSSTTSPENSKSYSHLVGEAL